MKTLLRLAFVLLLLNFSSCIVGQSSSKTTIILLRHAEKDTVGKDPELSIAGRERALRIPTLFKNIKPDLLYATPYIRTRQTLMPWAKQAGVDIREYNAKDSIAFAGELKLMKGKNIVVSGHSNTIPGLVNLLIGSNKYPNLNDNDYSKLWVVTINNGKAVERIVQY